MSDTTKPCVFSYDYVKIGDTLGLGAYPGEFRVDAYVTGDFTDGAGLMGFQFHVINGNWNGILHKKAETINDLYIVDERGVVHDPVYICRIVRPSKEDVPTRHRHDDEIPY